MINVNNGTTVQGNGSHDDTVGLQGYLNSAATASGGALYFPRGRYLITNTLVFPQKTGQHIFGSGMAEGVTAGGPAQGAESVIVWGGSSSLPMIRYEGEGLVWNGLSLWGRTPGTSGTRASAGILIKRPSGSPVNAGRIWFGSLLVEDCDTAVATASDTAAATDEVGFGYFCPRKCGVAVHLNHQNSVEYSFEYVHAVNCGIVFKVTNGGRVFTQAVRVLSSNTKVLEVLGGDVTNAFYNVNGLALDDGVDGTVLLNNVSTGSGTHHIRFTNAHLICADESTCGTPPTIVTSANCHGVTVTINRTGSTGQTMLELVGCRGLAAMNNKITITGASTTKKSYLIVRESEVRTAGQLINASSLRYECEGIENWTFPCGMVGNDTKTG